ncbi:MAG TPA: hypothetical protein VHT24_00315, partial [Pseudacidobacterium sp.]|nr:hypothetical protein [Pseudacidobacterium sp.]
MKQGGTSIPPCFIIHHFCSWTSLFDISLDHGIENGFRLNNKILSHDFADCLYLDGLSLKDV